MSMVSIIDNEYKNFIETLPEFRNNYDYSSFLFKPISDKLIDIS